MMTQPETTPVTTPCIQVCAVDGRTGWCLGCGRTLSEIGGWSACGAVERADILAKLPSRIEQLETLGKLVPAS
ncbi:MAG: DUF1289 domain-containing protein [Hyphomonadaceae bacterium]